MTSPTARFNLLAGDALTSWFEAHPNHASAIGLHRYDGRLGTYSRSGLKQRSVDLSEQIDRLTEIERTDLGTQDQVDYDVLVNGLKRELFDIEALKTHATNPVDAVEEVDVSSYIIRSYAPSEERFNSLASALDSVPRVVAELSEHLEEGLAPAPVIDAAIEAWQGMADFYRNDVVNEVSSHASPSTTERVKESAGKAARAVDNYVKTLTDLKDRAPSNFAIGGAAMSRLLELGEQESLSLPRLLDLGQQDLVRNSSRLREVAARIDPTKSPVDVMAQAGSRHPTSVNLLAETIEILEGIREFIAQHDLISLPSEDRCKVTRTPAFMRWAFAAMDTPGPYESVATESYYYVTEPDPNWSKDQQDEWLTSFSYGILQSMSIHEAYPGHFVQYQHTAGLESDVRKVFWSYAFVEGWAHYVEQMMIEQGYMADDPYVELGQLQEALLRNCRFVCALKMHTEGMTVDEATRFFMEHAMLSETPARAEAMRGTFDPLYLSYTLGKIQILKLREVCRDAWGEGFSLKAFHDRMLAHGQPPVALLSRLLIG